MIIAIDTGGTKTLISSFNKKGEMGDSVKFPTPKNTHEWARQVQQVVRDNYHGKPVEVIVVAVPGIVKGGIAVWCNNLKWRNVNIHKLLENTLDGVPVLVENDANLAGLSETRYLQPVPVSSLYITVSTGIGSGVITNGHIDPGLQHSEAGRALIEYDGVVREWESFASGRAIVDTYNKMAKDITSKRAWYQISDRISRGFLAVIPILQPDIIIIGGSVGTYFDRYGAMLRGILKEHLPPHIPCPKIIAAKHAEQAVVYGCYYYGIDYLSGR